MSLAGSGRALSFGGFAAEFARWRPSYPDEAVRWLVPENADRVADVGAGTGKLTGLLLELGLQVEAVEPDLRMLELLRKLHPEATSQRGSADSLPLADASVDAVLAADAWHWFPREEAVAEARRVLRPDGWLGLVWNVPTPLEPWEFELAEIDPDRRGLHDQEHEPQPPFPRPETRTASFPWTWELTPEHWRGFLATNSAVAAMDPAEREERLDKSQAIVERACRTIGLATAPVHYEAYCVRWQPR